MTPTRGRALRGQRYIGQTPYGHWHTTTFDCALKAEALVALVAPLVLDGPITAWRFGPG